MSDVCTSKEYPRLYDVNRCSRTDVRVVRDDLGPEAPSGGFGSGQHAADRVM